MTRSMTWTGLIATLALVLVSGIYALFEPSRQTAAQADLQADSIRAATDLYAANCAVCHGAAGEGIGAMPALNNEGLRTADPDALSQTIAFGRYNTAMAAWDIDNGGALTAAQIDQMVSLIQYGDWNSVGLRVAELGLTPLTAVQVEVPPEMLTQAALLPGGDALSRAITLYAEGCVACHGANGEGTTLAPALDSTELLWRMTDVDLTRTILEGVPGTLMAGWGNALTGQDAADLVMLIRRWDEVQAAGIQLPAVEVVTGPPSPEMAAAGAQLFGITCANCHGSSAQGTRMAPALYNQTFLSQTPDAAIAQIIMNGVPGTMMPAWGGRLTEADIQALVAYLRSLEPTAPVIGAPGG